MSSGWTIDELAALSGVPSRTIREYQTLGLLDGPERRGRVGYYRRDHQRRLDLLVRLQARGYSLAGIRDLLDAWSEGRSLADVVGAVTIDETPVALDRASLVTAWPALADDATLQRATEAGLLAPGGDDRWLLRSDALLTLVADLSRSGADDDTVFAAVAALRERAHQQGADLARVFADKVFSTHSQDDALQFARRARPLLAHAAASLLADALGAALIDEATHRKNKKLKTLVERLRVGAVHVKSQKESTS